jgi:hypothetical protein
VSAKGGHFHFDRDDVVELEKIRLKSLLRPMGRVSRAHKIRNESSLGRGEPIGSRDSVVITITPPGLSPLLSVTPFSPQFVNITILDRELWKTQRCEYLILFTFV